MNSSTLVRQIYRIRESTSGSRYRTFVIRLIIRRGSESRENMNDLDLSYSKQLQKEGVHPFRDSGSNFNKTPARRLVSLNKLSKENE